MKMAWILSASIITAVCGCAVEETEVAVDQTPEGVRRSIQRELASADLRDIARKPVNVQTVYETDVVQHGHEWRVVIREDGTILAKLGKDAYAADALGTPAVAERQEAWRDRFDVNTADLLPTGANRFITMQPGRVLKLKHGRDTLTVTVLADTQEVDGVTTGVLEERETKNGNLVEISRNFLATDKNTGDVYYFGEDVDNYKNGKITNHEGAWRAGMSGARFGLMIPAKPTVGQAFYQEIAPKVAMDRVEVVSINETIKTPAGTFEHCIHLRETTPLERGSSHKYYAPDVGIVKDDEFELAEQPSVVR
jgi:hypothetical protein